MEWTDWQTRRVAFRRERVHGLPGGAGPQPSPLHLHGGARRIPKDGSRGGTQSSGTKDIIDSKYTRMVFRDGPRLEEPDLALFTRAKVCCGLVVDAGSQQPGDLSLGIQAALLQLRKAAEFPPCTAKSSAQACGRGRPLKGPRCGVGGAGIPKAGALSGRNGY